MTLTRKSPLMNACLNVARRLAPIAILAFAACAATTARADDPPADVLQERAKEAAATAGSSTAAPVNVAVQPAAPPPAVAAPAAPSSPAALAKAAATLPHELSPWGMFLSADIVVKAVMTLLALASLATWTIWIAKTFELSIAIRRVRRDRAALAEERSLSAAAARFPSGRGIVAGLIANAVTELKLSSDLTLRKGIKERVESRLAAGEAVAQRLMKRGTGVLASVGATSPFIGLFGTVWGVMNSFIGISRSQTTNLAVVAPGIAEALLATALGLVAAIPAVLMYNQLTRAIASYRAEVHDASGEIARLVSRDLDRAGNAPHHVRPVRAAE